MVLIVGNEAVLFLRLHLLQGVVAFHQGRSLDANRILNQAKNELVKLSINDDDLSQLINLGSFKKVKSNLNK